MLAQNSVLAFLTDSLGIFSVVAHFKESKNPLFYDYCYFEPFTFLFSACNVITSHISHTSSSATFTNATHSSECQLIWGSGNSLCSRKETYFATCAVILSIEMNWQNSLACHDDEQTLTAVAARHFSVIHT